MADNSSATTPKPPKLWKKASLEWLNRPRTIRSKPSQSILRVNLAFGGGKTSDESDGSVDGSPPLPGSERLSNPTTPQRPTPKHQNSESFQPLSAVKALSSREVLMSMLDDPKCLWKFGQFLTFEANAEALVFWLNAEQHRQDLERLHNLTRRVHSLHVPTSAALALNISAAERSQLETASQAFLALEDPFTSARNISLEMLIRDPWPRFLHHRLTIMHDMEMRTLGSAPRGELDVATCFCITSNSSSDDYAIRSVSDGFVSITGYTHNEAIGRNCRFLQGAGTDASTVARIRSACRAGETSVELLLNYRRDGSPFQNFLRTLPLRDNAGRVVGFLGYQVNVARRSTLGPLLADELDALDERLPAGGMSSTSSIQKSQQVQTEGAILARLNAQAPSILGREQRLREAADLAFGATANKDRSTMSRPVSGIGGKSPMTPKSGSSKAGSSSRPSTAASNAESSGERESLLKDMSARWLVLDASGTTIVHADPRLTSLYNAGTDFSNVVKATAPSLPKRIKSLAKTGEAATERAKLALEAGGAMTMVTLAVAPMKGSDGKTCSMVILLGV